MLGRQRLGQSSRSQTGQTSQTVHVHPWSVSTVSTVLSRVDEKGRRSTRCELNRGAALPKSSLCQGIASPSADLIRLKEASPTTLQPKSRLWRIGGRSDDSAVVAVLALFSPHIPGSCRLDRRRGLTRRGPQAPQSRTSVATNQPLQIDLDGRCSIRISLPNADLTLLSPFPFSKFASVSPNAKSISCGGP